MRMRGSMRDRSSVAMSGSDWDGRGGLRGLLAELMQLAQRYVLGREPRDQLAQAAWVVEPPAGAGLCLTRLFVNEGARVVGGCPRPGVVSLS